MVSAGLAAVVSLLFLGGVDVSCLQLQTALGGITVARVYGQRGYPAIVTSACDGKHGEPTLHPDGGALDFRTIHVPKEKRPALAEAVSEALGDEFDVVLETDPDHLHIEYDPVRRSFDRCIPPSRAPPADPPRA